MTINLIKAKRLAIKERKDLITKWIAINPLIVSDSVQQEMIECTASDITEAISNRKWTATQVVNAFIHRAWKAHLELNCLTEILFEEATELAAKLDEEFL